MIHTKKKNELLAHIAGSEKLKGKKILITGACGLIGSSIAETLLLFGEDLPEEQKPVVFAAGRSEEKFRNRFAEEEGPFFRFLRFDACEPVLSFKESFDYIIHCASNAHPAAYVKEPVETMLSNLTGTETLLNYGRQCGAQRFLYVSSSEVYGKKDSPDSYREEDYGFLDLLNPRACYPSAKRAAETLCSAFSEEFGLETVIVRPGHIYGAVFTQADTRAYAQFLQNAAEGEDIVMKSAGSQMRSYCYSYDCAAAILSVLTSGASQNAYNISDESCLMTIRELAEYCATAGGAKVVFDIPSEEEAKGYNLMDNSSLNGEKIASLGWSCAFSPEEAIQESLAVLRSLKK